MLAVTMPRAPDLQPPQAVGGEGSEVVGGRAPRWLERPRPGFLLGSHLAPPDGDRWRAARLWDREGYDLSIPTGARRVPSRPPPQVAASVLDVEEQTLHFPGGVRAEESGHGDNRVPGAPGGVAE
jgi:hypothetical protein